MVCTPLKRPFPLGLKAKGVQGAGFFILVALYDGLLPKTNALFTFATFLYQKFASFQTNKYICNRKASW
jgi:hypothetical protein